MKTKSENRKALPWFILSTVLSLFVGAGIGVGILFIHGSWSQRLMDAVRTGLAASAPWLIWAFAICITAIAIMICQRFGKLFPNWHEEDLATLSKMENSLSLALIAESVLTILSFFLFAAQLTLMDLIEAPVFFIGVGGFLALMAASTVCQQKVVDFEKKLNPEKRGSVYDAKFAKKWYESCDEWERAMICQAAFSAYSATNLACVVLWVLLILGHMLFDFGLLPIAVVTILWLVSTLAYSIKAWQLESGRKKS